jgi:hypothetical protein
MRILILLLFPLFSYSQLSIGILESSRFFVADSTAPKAFITAANITDGTQISAIYSLAFGLQRVGLWNKIKAIYPMVGGVASSHKYNLKDPRDLDSAYRLTFNGGWTHTSGGAKGDGSSAFGNSYLNTSTLGIDNIHVSYSIRNPNTNNGRLWGVSNAVDAVTRLTNNSYIVNDLTLDLYTNIKLSNFTILTRTASNSKKIYIDGSVSASATTASVATATVPIYLNAENLFSLPNNYSNAECSFASIGDGLSDADAANLNTLVQNFNTTLNRQIIIPTVSDADAQLFLNSAVITDSTQANAINDLVVGLKADTLWTKMQAIYPFVGGTASSHKFNLKSPFDLNSSFRLDFFGGWTHSSTGAKPNGTNGYAASYFIPSAQQNVNSNGMGAYFTQFTVAGADPVQMGDFTGVTQSSALIATPTSIITRLNGSVISGSITGGGGSFDVQRTSSTVTTLYKNGSSVATGNSGGTLSTITDGIFLGTLNILNVGPYSSGYNNSEFRFAYFSEGLNSTEIGNLRTRVQAYQTSLSRQL